MEKEVRGKTISEWLRNYPLLKEIIEYKPVIWLNSRINETNNNNKIVSFEETLEAQERWNRFSSYLLSVFPELQKTNGEIKSPLRKIDNYKKIHLKKYLKEKEEFYLKCDHLLPVAGSIKARGGMYEVLKYAENLALKYGMITIDDDYRIFRQEKFKSLFKNYTIGVASTGNLALSIGMIGTALGFNVDVHMSSDAKAWKKELLRKHGVRVHEYKGDFSEAIKTGREKIQAEPSGYFIDDENSKDLFLGYSTAALELQQQLKDEGITISADQPLFVYLPCGVGGSPSGIAFGLHELFGDNVHCFFAEPTHSPSFLIGLMTGLKEEISVDDFGLDNKTTADGLAVGRPSSFASSVSSRFVRGIYTENDNEFREMGLKLWQSEDLFVEPSAAAGLSGPKRVYLSKYQDRIQMGSSKAVHVTWSTGGSLVPENERRKLYEKGEEGYRNV